MLVLAILKLVNTVRLAIFYRSLWFEVARHLNTLRPFRCIIKYFWVVAYTLNQKTFVGSRGSLKVSDLETLIFSETKCFSQTKCFSHTQ